MTTNETVRITRRSRLMVSVDYSPTPATIEECERMTPRQLLDTYREYRQNNPNASVFVTIYRNGRRLAWHSEDFRELVHGPYDDLTVNVIS